MNGSNEWVGACEKNIFNQCPQMTTGMMREIDEWCGLNGGDESITLSINTINEENNIGGVGFMKNMLHVTPPQHDKKF